MGFLTATAKTVATRVLQKSHQKKMDKAQPKAYATACKKAHGKFDPNWKTNYNRALKRNKQKANDSKELWFTFINNL